MEQKFIIEGRLEGFNNCIYANRAGKYRGNRFKQDEQEKVIKAIKESNLERVVDYPIQMLFYFYEKDRRRDIDNISGWAHKCIQDALVETEILDDDSQKYVAAHADCFLIDKEHPRIEVVLKSFNQAENQNYNQK